jgi:uncharacterized protein (DUF934 family)
VPETPSAVFQAENDVRRAPQGFGRTDEVKSSERGKYHGKVRANGGVLMVQLIYMAVLSILAVLLVLWVLG